MKYEYDRAMDETYQKSLLKSFRKTIDDSLFNFVIVDMVNNKMNFIEEMSIYAKLRGFQVYIVELNRDAENCYNRNIHNRSLKDIRDLENEWDPLPSHFTKLNIDFLMQDEDIENVEMDDAVAKIEDTKVTSLSLFLILNSKKI
jgi:tRNA uridine 5-carbamoylmethylation protein Kti12